MKLTLILLLLSFTAYGQMAKHATIVPQPDQYWALAKDSITWMESKGQTIIHVEATDTATYVLTLYKKKKKWPVVVTPPVTTTIKVEAESFVSQINTEIFGNMIRPYQGWLSSWSANYNVTTGGQTKISITYYNGNPIASILTVRAGKTLLGTFSLPPTGSWVTMKTLQFTLLLPINENPLFLGLTTGINFDYFILSK